MDFSHGVQEYWPIGVQNREWCRMRA
jgi:hypothetical protein